MKGYILPFHKKSNLGIPKNYRGVALTAIAVNPYFSVISKLK